MLHLIDLNQLADEINFQLISRQTLDPNKEEGKGETAMGKSVCACTNVMLMWQIY